MLPELFHIGSFPIRSFGVAMLVAFLVSLYAAKKRAPEHGIDTQQLFDLAFWVLIFGVLGARIVFIAQEWDFYSKHQDQLWALKFEGLTSFGGILFGFGTMVFWAKRKKVPLSNVLDTLAVPFLIGHAIGRVGCLLNGCCFGGPCPPPLGVHFAGVPGTHHPAQIYDSIMLLAGAFALTRLEKRKLDPGQSASLSVVIYGLSRFIYEFWRAGTPEQVREGIASSTYMGNLPITDAQALALVFVLLGLLFFVVRRRPTANSTAEPA